MLTLEKEKKMKKYISQALIIYLHIKFSCCFLLIFAKFMSKSYYLSVLKKKKNIKIAKCLEYSHFSPNSPPNWINWVLDGKWLRFISIGWGCSLGTYDEKSFLA